MSADPSLFAMVAKRAKLLGTLEACSVTRRGLGAAERFDAIESAIVGAVALDESQRRFVLAEFSDAFHESSSHMRAAAEPGPLPLQRRCVFTAAETRTAPVGGDDDDEVTLVDPPPGKVKAKRRFLYWFLPCLALLGCGGADAQPAPDVDPCQTDNIAPSQCHQVPYGTSSPCGSPLTSETLLCCCVGTDRGAR
jgi:hypothetical protein